MLDKARKDKNWTAALEQTGKYSKLPPAIILDLDETSLDNLAFQARQVLQNKDFDQNDWTQWISEARAKSVPGAAEFCKYADSVGVRVFYVTNRSAAEEPATRENLNKLGFPVYAKEDVILTRGENPDWSSDKGSRRKLIAARYRILLLCGDDFGDFMSGIMTSIARRKELAAQYASNWGTKWIVLPNPSYGSWERALASGMTNPTPADRLKRELELVDPSR
jgi:acid phosphatase